MTSVLTECRAQGSFYAASPAQQAISRLLEAADGNVSEVAAVLRLDRSTVYRVMRGTRLRYDAADTIAVALGRHPVELWPHWYQPEHLNGDLP